MSPILVRPVREQFEHDRVIRVLEARYKRKYEVVINPGAEQNASVSVGELAMFPDLVLFSLERSRKLEGTVEVETAESINTLEAMAEWVPFGRLRAAFHLYVPVNSLDTVRRLCADYGVAPAEIWTYHPAIDQVRFTMVYRDPDAPKRAEPREAVTRGGEAAPVKADKAAKPDKAGKPTEKSAEKPAAKPDRAAKADKPEKAAKPVRPAAAAKTVKAVKAVKTAKRAAAPAKSSRPAAGRAGQARRNTASARPARAAKAPARTATARKAVKTKRR